jgi:outer membrane protein assembly factor BamE
MPPVPEATQTPFSMRKLLIPITAIASLLLVACSGDPIVNRLPWVYRIDIQQGNVLTQDALNQVRLGMNKRQVQFILGTPLLADPFHADRWDYFYDYRPGTDGEGKPEKQRVSLFFEADKLSRMAGSLEPQPPGTATEPARQMTVTVPPQEIEEPGVLTRMWRWIGFGSRDGDYGSSQTSTNRESGAPAPGAPPVY